ncbi:hypothetical protein N302_01416, partial [Corvus brachyrhynchos]
AQSHTEQGTLHSTPVAGDHSATTPGAQPQLLPGQTDRVQRGAGLRSHHHHQHHQHMMPEPGWPQQSTLVPTAMAWSYEPGHCRGHSPGDHGGDT